MFRCFVESSVYDKSETLSWSFSSPVYDFWPDYAGSRHKSHIIKKNALVLRYLRTHNVSVLPELNK